ncbi:integrase core domain-containing protein [Nonomuraea longicatena]|uniref:Integrase catalytic domain-containing protein n=1 Tax=Nonomuraea longicatena TaxID=83682 RepID=A0ABN1QWP9_9ACTN
MAESFFSALKSEWLNRYVFTSQAQAKRQGIHSIERFCNRRRLHSALDYRPPQEIHNEHDSSHVAA